MMNHQWTSRHADFLKALTASLDMKGIRYFILRNFEKLPEENMGRDVDIVLEPRAYAASERLMRECMKQHGLRYYALSNFDRMRCWYIMDADECISIHIDLMENEVYHGFELFRFEELYAHVVPYKGFYALNETWHAIVLLVQNLVAYKSLKSRYQTAISAAYGRHAAEMERILKTLWGARAGEQLCRHIQQEDYDRLLAAAPLWSRRALRRIWLKRPLSTTKNMVRFLCTKMYQLLWCPRRTQHFIAVEAPDGTGKTTFIEALVERLSFYYCSGAERFCIHHFRPQLLPNLGAMGEKVGVMKQDTDFSKPHRARPAGFLGSLLRMVYYWLDYVIGVPLLLRKEAQYGYYTIFDRYSYDFLVDPHRSRINLPTWLRWLFVRMTLQPSIVFVLQADAEVVYRRKQELSPEEIERQLAEFHKLEKLGKRCVFVDAEQSPQAMAEQAVRVIMERMMEKAT